MIIFPTKGRPQLLKRALKCCEDTGVTERILLVFNEDDRKNYEEKYTASFPIDELIIPAGSRLNDCFNKAVEAYPNEPYYGQVSDDCTPETPKWDVKLRDACVPDKIAWPCDSLGSGKLPGFAFLGGDLVRKMGFFYPHTIKHWYTDNFLGAIVNKMGNGVYLPHIMLRHRHMVNGLAERDATYENQPDHNADGLAYADFLREEFEGLCKKIAA